MHVSRPCAVGLVNRRRCERAFYAVTELIPIQNRSAQARGAANLVTTLFNYCAVQELAPCLKPCIATPRRLAPVTLAGCPCARWPTTGAVRHSWPKHAFADRCSAPRGMWVNSGMRACWPCATRIRPRWPINATATHCRGACCTAPMSTGVYVSPWLAQGHNCATAGMPGAHGTPVNTTACCA